MVRETSEALVGGVTGSVAAPRSLLLGRFDVDGRPRYTGRTTTLSGAARSALASLLAPAGGDHPWMGWTFSAGWATRERLNVTLVHPELVVEVSPLMSPATVLAGGATLFDGTVFEPRRIRCKRRSSENRTNRSPPRSTSCTGPDGAAAINTGPLPATAAGTKSPQPHDHDLELP
ncbi:hypothetical protein OG866_44015 [Streptomyces sp. NBC_00663]|uniref:hypothetical protein n=1 Tax=Streptomyces sp. NBC_00663 TaxID=2975801 RepID=UPI002E3486E0|nr:hypothetical protein [Streptomyces sp. NBC_00663]